jgi:hypothetical protein
MLTFAVKFYNTPELQYRLNDTELAHRYLDLLQTQYSNNSCPIFRDQHKYTLDYFSILAQRAQYELGWNWIKPHYDLSITTRLHKDIEQYLAQGFKNIPEEHDELLHELHFCLHAIESGSKRNNWLQIEWYNDCGFEIDADEYPAKLNLDFGDLRLQNPYVGHHPLHLYQQQDSINIMQTCRFHNFVKPGMNLVINPEKNLLDINKYLNWFQTYSPNFLQQHSEEILLKFTGHPVIGCVVNKYDLETVIATPVLEFEYLKF